MSEKEFAKIQQRILKIEKMLSTEDNFSPENRFWEIICNLIPVLEKIIELIPDKFMVLKIIMEMLVKLLKELCKDKT